MPVARKIWDSRTDFGWHDTDREALPISRIAVLGPTRHIRALLEWSRIFSARGHVVFSPTLWTIAVGQNHRGIADDTTCLVRQLEVLRCATSVFVVDLGELEPEFTTAIQELAGHGIEVRHLSDEYPQWTERDCEYLSAEELRAFPPGG